MSDLEQLIIKHALIDFSKSNSDIYRKHNSYIIDELIHDTNEYSKTFSEYESVLQELIIYKNTCVNYINTSLELKELNKKENLEIHSQKSKKIKNLRNKIKKFDFTKKTDYLNELSSKLKTEVLISHLHIDSIYDKQLLLLDRAINKTKELSNKFNTTLISTYLNLCTKSIILTEREEQFYNQNPEFKPKGSLLSMQERRMLNNIQLIREENDLNNLNDQILNSINNNYAKLKNQQLELFNQPANNERNNELIILCSNPLLINQTIQLYEINNLYRNKPKDYELINNAIARLHRSLAAKKELTIIENYALELLNKTNG